MKSARAQLGCALRLGIGEDYPTGDGKTLQTELSRQLVRLIDVLYALVLVQGAVYYRYVFTLLGFFDHPTKWVPVSLALVLIYFTTIQSFVDYHLASEDQGYQVLDRRYRRSDLARYYLDVVIVGSYSFLLLKSHTLIRNPQASLSATFWALPVIFLLYWLWGWLRRQSSAKQPYSSRLLVLTGVLYLVLAVIYADDPGGSLRNSCALGAALVVMVVYRWLNWPQNRAIEYPPVAPQA